ncbi:MAG: hypothetical protein ACRYFV_01655 [Janthinobacterium lividum]
MTYAAIVDLIQETATAAGAGSFWVGEKTKQDINYNAAFPQVYLFEMPSTLVGTSVETVCTMAFYGKDEHENGTADSVNIQDAMDLLSQRFISLLREADEAEVAPRVDRGPILRKGATIGTGFVCVFKLTTLSDAC